MKQGTLHHRKIKRLMRALRIERLVAVGILESLWNVTADSPHTRQGNIGCLSDEDIAEDIAWQDAPERLVAALCETGWLDKSPEHRLVIHDWHIHAPNWVKGLLKRAGLPFLTDHQLSGGLSPTPITQDLPPAKTGSKTPTKTPTKCPTESDSARLGDDDLPPGCEPFDSPGDPPGERSPLMQALQEFAGTGRVIPAKWRDRAEEFERDHDLNTVKRALGRMKMRGHAWGKLGFTVMAIVKEEFPEPGRGVVPTRTPGASSPKSAKALADDAKAREKRDDLQRRFKAIPAGDLAGLFDRLRAEHHMLQYASMPEIRRNRGWVGKYLAEVVAMYEGGTV